MKLLTTAELDALEQGLATWHNDRLIPIMKGGDDTDLGDVDDDPGTDDTPADDPADTADTPDDTPDEPVVPQAARIDWTDPEAQAALREHATVIAREMVAAQTPAPPEQRQGFDWDSLDPLGDGFGAGLREGLRELITEVVGPTNQYVEAQRQNEQFEQVRQAADAEMTRLSVDEADRPHVLQIATGIQAASHASGQPITDSAALQAASRALTDRDARIAAAAIEKYKADLKAKAGAPAQPPGAGAAGIEVAEAPGSLVEAARRFAERNELPAAS